MMMTATNTYTRGGVFGNTHEFLYSILVYWYTTVDVRVPQVIFFSYGDVSATVEPIFHSGESL